jgi:hypothetical protein
LNKIGFSHLFPEAQIYNESSIRKHIERQLVAQFDRFVKQTILAKGKPPKKNVTRLMKSLSTKRILPRHKSEKLDLKHKNSKSRKRLKRRHKSTVDKKST